MKLCIWIFGGTIIIGLASQAYLLANQAAEPTTTVTQPISPSLQTRSLQSEPNQDTISKSFNLPSASNSGTPVTLEQISPALVKLGFGFFVGLSIGFVVKAFF